MPHVHIDYSANLENVIDLGDFCEALRAEAVQIDALPMPGMRVRAVRVDHYAIADGNPAHGFVDVTLRLLEGRSDDVKRDVLARLFATAEAFLAPAMAGHSIALSMELREIDAEFSAKCGTIRDHLQATP